jgi:hypothetical protein
MKRRVLLSSHVDTSESLEFHEERCCDQTINVLVKASLSRAYAPLFRSWTGQHVSTNAAIKADHALAIFAATAFPPMLVSLFLADYLTFTTMT